jgi:lysophospholipase L1-like esterase
MDRVHRPGIGPIGKTSMRRTGVRLVMAVVVATGVLVVVLFHGRGVALPMSAAGDYVALGDSYVAGPGIPTTTGVPLSCGRSSNDYPSLVRAAVHASAFTDASCSGATTGNMTAPQTTRTGANPPQLDAVTSRTRLVTVTIGGNDIGFSEIVGQCLSRSAGQPAGAACRVYFNRSGSDVLAQRIAATAPKVAAVLTRIKARAPSAKVLLVGYPTLFPASGGGCPEAPFSAGDIAYLDQTFQALNAMLRTQAGVAGARFVGPARSSAGHDICAPAGTRWIEGRNPTSPAAAFHPNALGMRNTAYQVVEALGAVP